MHALCFVDEACRGGNEAHRLLDSWRKLLRLEQLRLLVRKPGVLSSARASKEAPRHGAGAGAHSSLARSVTKLSEQLPSKLTPVEGRGTGLEAGKRARSLLPENASVFTLCQPGLR